MFEFLPESLSIPEAACLVVLSGITSMLTAAVGIGGGVLLLAAMAQLLPVNALIPVHGLVQLGSNGSRAWLMRQYVDKSMVIYFGCGAMLGALIASSIVVQLPLYWIQLSVALFILYLVWGPKLYKHEVSNIGHVLAGAVTTVVSMFVGATGPLVAGFVHRQRYSKFETTGTFAACMSLQHFLKMLVFTAIGFSFWQWLPMIILMILSGLVGTWVGLKLLNRVPEALFKQIYKVVVTLLAMRLLWQVMESL